MTPTSGYKSNPPIKINDKNATLDEIYVSPLGHLMVKVYFPSTRIWNTYNVGEWSDIILPLIKEKN